MEELESVGILSLPNEKILEICSTLSDRDLSRFMQTYKNVEAVCRDELERRKQGPSRRRYGLYQSKQKAFGIVRKVLQQSDDPDVSMITIVIVGTKIVITYDSGDRTYRILVNSVNKGNYQTIDEVLAKLNELLTVLYIDIRTEVIYSNRDIYKYTTITAV